MTGSRRRTPIFGNTTAKSEKQFKQAENRKARRASRIAVDQGQEPPHAKDHGDPWNGDKDGKTYRPDFRAPDLWK